LSNVVFPNHEKKPKITLSVVPEKSIYENESGRDPTRFDDVFEVLSTEINNRKKRCYRKIQKHLHVLCASAVMIVSVKYIYIKLYKVKYTV